MSSKTQYSDKDNLVARKTNNVPEKKDNRLKKLEPKGSKGFNTHKYFMVRVSGTYLRTEREINEKKSYDITVPMSIDTLLKGPLGMFLQPELGYTAMRQLDPAFEAFLTYHQEEIIPIDELLGEPLSDAKEIDEIMIGSGIPELMSVSQMKRFIKQEGLDIDARLYPTRDDLCVSIKKIWEDSEGFKKLQSELAGKSLAKLERKVVIASDLEKFGFKDNSSPATKPSAKSSTRKSKKAGAEAEASNTSE